MLKNKKPLVRIGIIFIVLLLFLTFFSNTIYDFNLTNVVVDFPGSGVLTRRADGTGIVGFVETDLYLAQADGRITFYVSEGDMVRAGSPLFTIDADKISLRQALDDHLLNEERVYLRIDRASNSLERTQAELVAGLPDAQRRNIEAAISDTQYQIRELELELRATREAAERLREQIANIESGTGNAGGPNGAGGTDDAYGTGQVHGAHSINGAIFLSGAYSAYSTDGSNDTDNANGTDSTDGTDSTNDVDVESLRQALNELLQNEERILLRIERTNDGLWRTQAELTARMPEAQRRSIEATVSDIQFQIKELELDLQASRVTAQRLRDQIADMENLTSTSERDGRVLGISTDSGMFVNTNSVIMEIGATEAGFSTIVELPGSVDFLNVGDEVTLNMRARDIFGITGEIIRLSYESGQLRTELQINDENLTGGERLELSVQYISQLHETLIPNRALRSDPNGDYVLIVEMVSGTLRDEFYARRVTVRPISADNRHTSIIMIVHEMSPIIIDSDRVVSAGDRIRIVGGRELVGVR
jgi:multidrug efflux pump subunit AcrA (membrane-fusion protein)